MHRSSYPRSSFRSADTMRCAGAPVPGALLALALALGACGQVPAAGSDLGDPSLRLEGSQSTLHDVGRAALAGLAAGDLPRLQALRLTEQEHNELVWPELPASAPEVSFPVDFAWSNIESRNASALSRIMSIYEGEALVFQDVECRGGVQTFESFQVLTDCWVVFTREGSADVWQARLFKDVLVRGGGHKIFRFYDERPEPHPDGAREAT